MHEEDGFLSAIRQTPADDTARLVFADWLDEQDDPACKTKAAFIRLELRMAEAPEEGPGRTETLAHLRSLAAETPPSWLAVIGHAKLEACQQSTRFTCPGRWELLAPTSSDDMRRCGQCIKAAVFCTSIEDARMQIQYGHCVAVSPAVFRWSGDLGSSESFGRNVRLTPEMIERLRVASARGMRLDSVPLPPPPPPPLPPPPPVTHEWVPLSPMPNLFRTNRNPKRKKGRGQNRNLQRENWEDAE